VTSIRRTLTLALLAGILGLSAALGSALYFSVRAILVGEFDSALSIKTRALGSLVRQREDGRLDFEFSWDMVPEFLPSDRAEFFQLRSVDGTTFLRSRSLQGSELPAIDAGDDPRARDIPLPNGRPGRALAIRFTPRVEIEAEEDPDEGEVRPEIEMPVGPLILSLARDRSEIDRPLGVLLTSLIAAVAAMAVGVTLLVAAIVGRGLRPLDSVARRASAIDARDLEARFPVDEMPRELQPICLRLNDLLERLGTAFRRERRFTADVAHELRTPIAELRSLTEVALKFPSDDEEAKGWVQDAHDIARQMETLVTALLSLARCQAGRQSVQPGPADLAAVVRQVWRGLEAKAGSRRLAATFDLPAEALLRTDPAMLAAIVSNTLSNAVEHAPPGGDIACRIVRGPDSIEWEVRNSSGPLTHDDLSQLFEPFWQKDPSRSRRTGESSGLGLGLALVDAYVQILEGKIETSLVPPDHLSLKLRLPLDLTIASPREGAEVQGEE
jgi:two-component system heavy metal sensor histidine kinase CusS